MSKQVGNKPKEIRHSVKRGKDGYQETGGKRKHDDAPGDQAFFPRYLFHKVGKNNEKKSSHQPWYEIDHDCDHDPQCESESRSQPDGDLAFIMRNREQEDQIPS